MRQFFLKNSSVSLLQILGFPGSDKWRPRIHSRVIHDLLLLQCPPKKLKLIGAEQSLKIYWRLFKNHLWTHANTMSRILIELEVILSLIHAFKKS